MDDPVLPVMPTLVPDSPGGDNAGIPPTTSMPSIGAVGAGAASPTAAIDDDVTGEMAARSTIPGAQPGADPAGMSAPDVFDSPVGDEPPPAPDGTDGWLPTDDRDVQGAARSGLNMEAEPMMPPADVDTPPDPQDDPLGV